MEIEFEIINFSQYVKRTDCRTHWFAFEADILLHPDFFEITGNEFKVFVWCLSVATKIRNNKVRLNVIHTIKMLDVSEKDVLNCFDKLEKKRMISTARNVNVTSEIEDVTKSRLHNITLQNRTLQNRTEQNRTLSSEEKLLNSKIWESYCDAYRRRYKVDPIRNASVNAQVSQLRKRVGENAIKLVEFYLGHTDGFYLSKTHSFGLCLKDCETLMTQMQRGKAITRTTIKQFESIQNHAELLDSIRTNGV